MRQHKNDDHFNSKITIVGRLVLLLLFLALGCESPERPRIIQISAPPVFRPNFPRAVETLENVMASVITVCRDDLGLPVVDPLSVYLYKNTASFAHFAFSRKIAPTDIKTLIAFGGSNEIHINQKGAEGPQWGLYVPLLAHEYAHNLHPSPMSNVSRFPAWVTEGFASWVAAKTLDSLGWQDYETSLGSAKQELIRYHNELSNISSLSDGEVWTVTSGKTRGWIRTYGLAFVAMDELMKKTGPQAALRYFRSGNFDASFKVSLEDFVSDFQKLLSSMTRQEKDVFTIHKPDWKTGYKWVYEERTPGETKTLQKQVRKEDAFNEIAAFVVRENEEDFYYSKRSLALVASKKGNNVSSRRDRPNEFFAWPLKPTKEWRNSFVLEEIPYKQSRMIDRVTVVRNIEPVRVPAGVFSAVKIESYDYVSGRLQVEYWYSPSVKWIVKSINYFGADGFARDQQLKSFHVD